MRNVAHVPLVMFSWLSNKFVAEKIGIVTLMKMFEFIAGLWRRFGFWCKFCEMHHKKNTAYLLWYAPKASNSTGWIFTSVRFVKGHIQGHGNSLFCSVSFGLYTIKDDHYALRELSMNNIQENWDDPVFFVLRKWITHDRHRNYQVSNF